jgi:hypothetical protein
MISEDAARDLPVEYRARAIRCLNDMIAIRRAWIDAATALVAELDHAESEDG